MDKHASRGGLAAAIFAVAVAAAFAIGLPGSSFGAGKTLFDSIGGEPVLRAVVHDFTEIVENDDRINFTFAQTDLGKFKELLYEQLCNLAKGPCRYTGRDMRAAHAKLKINDAEFNALAEDLYIAFEHSHVPYRLQNKMMAMLAPMQRDIVK